MPLSTKDYFDAFRAGDYLALLEWPQYVGTTYQANEQELAADELVNLLIFEAINHGFTLEDAKWLAVLCALRESNPHLMRGALDYALTSLTVVIFECMIYWRQDVYKDLLCSGKKTSKEIAALITLCNEHLKEQQSLLMEREQEAFALWVQEASLAQCSQVYEQISAIITLRNSASDYITIMELELAEEDKLKTSRLSVLKRLAHYLNSHRQLSDKVLEEIAHYVAKIWELNPEHWEEDYLILLSPPTLELSLWQKLTQVGLSFFSLLEPEDEEPIVESPLVNKR